MHFDPEISGKPEDIFLQVEDSGFMTEDQAALHSILKNSIGANII